MVGKTSAKPRTRSRRVRGVPPWAGLGLAGFLAMASLACKPARKHVDEFGQAVAAADLVWEHRAEAGGVDEAEETKV